MVPGMRRIVALLLTLGLLPAASAANAEPIGTGPSGARYDAVLTCATNTVTVTADARGVVAANPFDFAIVDGGYVQSTIGRLLPGHLLNTWTISQTSLPTPEPIEVIENFTKDEETSIALIAPRAEACPTYEEAPRSTLVPMTPVRVLDTRPSSSIGYFGAKPKAGQVVNVPIAGRIGIPNAAIAVVVNVTIVDATQPGFVQVLPEVSQETLGAWSNVNADQIGQIIPNGTIAPLGGDGSMSLYTEQGAHLLIDVAGYFIPSIDPVAPGRFGQVPQTRVLDTRSRLGYSGSKPAAGATVRVAVTGGLLPTTEQVSAVALNVTAVDATGAGFIQVGPGGRLVPGASSSLNLEPNQTVANFVIVPVGSDGTIELYTSDGAHLLVDVLGVFSQVPSFAGGFFVPIDPERVLDTRPTSAIAYTTASIKGFRDPYEQPGSLSHEVGIGFHGLAADGARAVLINVTATDAGGPGFVQAAPRADGRTSNLNLERSGQTIANSAAVSLNTFSMMSLYTQGPAHLIADVFGFFSN
jgi:hypothetical protein